MAWVGLCFTLLASILFAVSAVVIRATDRDDYEVDYCDAMRDHAIESMEHYNNTLMRHGSMATLVRMPPMPLNTVMHHGGGSTTGSVFPQGYQPFPHMPDDRAFNDDEDVMASYHKIGKELNDAKL